MPHSHDEHCSHGPVHDEHAHRNPCAAEEPLDAANQSLADALKSSFSILKAILLVLIVLYLFSNVRGIGVHEQALILRLGRLLPEVHEAGLVWAFPFPIDEIIPLPTRKSNDLVIDSHTFHRREDEIGRPLTFISRGRHEGLHPALDGALLTADTGLVHMQWKATYKFDDVAGYVSNVGGEVLEAAERLIRAAVETVGIQVATEMTAEEMIRTRVDFAQSEMRRRVNERLAKLSSGVVVTMIEMFEPTPPLQVREAFDGTQRAENSKQQRIRNAEQGRTKVLSEAAGSAYPRLIQVLDAMDAAKGDSQATEGLGAELDRLWREEVEGEAGKRIKDSSTYFSVAVRRMESDVERYRTLLPEYERNPSMLVNRLWEQTKMDILQMPGVSKLFRSPGFLEFRVKIPLDPEQTRSDEELRVKQKEFDPAKVRPKPLHPVGPEGE